MGADGLDIHLFSLLFSSLGEFLVFLQSYFASQFNDARDVVDGFI